MRSTLRLNLCAVVVAMTLIPMSGSTAETPIVVQFEALMLPAISEKGYRGRTTVTPYMKVKNAEALARACARLPRILDVMLVAFEEKPLLMSDSTNDLADRQEELARKIEGSIGKGVFVGFYLIQGTKHRGEGTELLHIDGGTDACQPIKYLPSEPKPPQEIMPATQATAEQEPRKFNRLSELAQSFSDQTPSTPRSLSEAELAAAERELLADVQVRKSFPPPPPVPGRGTSWAVISIAIVGLGGLMLLFGSYIGYQVAKIRRDRRRAERRLKKINRRSGIERRQRQDGPPEEGERRAGKDRRLGSDRRAQSDADRRASRDRRDEAAAAAAEQATADGADDADDAPKKED